MLDAISDWFPRLHSLVVGPGLGCDPVVLARVKKLVVKAKEMQKNIVIDAVSFNMTMRIIFPSLGMVKAGV